MSKQGVWCKLTGWWCNLRGACGVKERVKELQSDEIDDERKHCRHLEEEKHTRNEAENVRRLEVVQQILKRSFPQ